MEKVQWAFYSDGFGIMHPTSNGLAASAILVELVLDGLSLSRPVLVRDWICYQAMEQAKQSKAKHSKAKQSKAKQSKTSPVRIGSVVYNEWVMMVSMMGRIVCCGCSLL